MSRITEMQLEKAAKVQARIQQVGVVQARIARELNRSPAAVCRALRGERRMLLDRIVRWLDRYEAQKQSTKSKSTQAA